MRKVGFENGEYVTARKFRNMAKEMMLKASLYNMFTNMM